VDSSTYKIQKQRYHNRLFLTSLGESDAIFALVENGVILTDEYVSQNPHGSCGHIHTAKTANAKRDIHGRDRFHFNDVLFGRQRERFSGDGERDGGQELQLIAIHHRGSVDRITLNTDGLVQTFHVGRGAGDQRSARVGDGFEIGRDCFGVDFDRVDGELPIGFFS